MQKLDKRRKLMEERAHEHDEYVKRAKRLHEIMRNFDRRYFHVSTPNRKWTDVVHPPSTLVDKVAYWFETRNYRPGVGHSPSSQLFRPGGTSADLDVYATLYHHQALDHLKSGRQRPGIGWQAAWFPNRTIPQVVPLRPLVPRLPTCTSWRRRGDGSWTDGSNPPTKDNKSPRAWSQAALNELLEDEHQAKLNYDITGQSVGTCIRDAIPARVGNQVFHATRFVDHPVVAFRSRDFRRDRRGYSRADAFRDWDPEDAHATRKQPVPGSPSETLYGGTSPFYTRKSAPPSPRSPRSVASVPSLALESPPAAAAAGGPQLPAMTAEDGDESVSAEYSLEGDLSSDESDEDPHRHPRHCYGMSARMWRDNMEFLDDDGGPEVPADKRIYVEADVETVCAASVVPSDQPILIEAVADTGASRHLGPRHLLEPAIAQEWQHALKMRAVWSGSTKEIPTAGHVRVALPTGAASKLRLSTSTITVHLSPDPGTRFLLSCYSVDCVHGTCRFLDSRGDEVTARLRPRPPSQISGRVKFIPRVMVKLLPGGQLHLAEGAPPQTLAAGPPPAIAPRTQWPEGVAWTGPSPQKQRRLKHYEDGCPLQAHRRAVASGEANACEEQHHRNGASCDLCSRLHLMAFPGHRTRHHGRAYKGAEIVANGDDAEPSPAASVDGDVHLPEGPQPRH